MANGVIDLRRQGPSTGAQIADLGQNMLQFFMQREQLELQKEQQGLREKAFKQDLAERQAEQQRIEEAQAGQAAALQNFLEQNPQVAQQLQQAGVQIPGGAGAAPLLQGLQQQQQLGLQGRQIEADITATEARTEATRAQTEIAREGLKLDQRRIGIEERLANIRELTAKSEAGLNAAQAKALETERRLAPVKITQEILKDRRDTFASLVPELGETMASFVAYGQPTRPNEKDLAAGMSNTIKTLIEADDFDPATVSQLVIGDPSTQLAQRLGIGPKTQSVYQSGLETLGANPSGKQVNDYFASLVREIDSFEDVSKDQRDAQKAAAAIFVQQQTGIKPQAPERRSWFESLKRFLTQASGVQQRQALLQQRQTAR